MAEPKLYVDPQPKPAWIICVDCKDAGECWEKEVSRGDETILMTLSARCAFSMESTFLDVD